MGRDCCVISYVLVIHNNIFSYFSLSNSGFLMICVLVHRYLVLISLNSRYLSLFQNGARALSPAMAPVSTALPASLPRRRLSPRLLSRPQQLSRRPRRIRRLPASRTVCCRSGTAPLRRRHCRPNSALPALCGEARRPEMTPACRQPTRRQERCQKDRWRQDSCHKGSRR